MNGSVHSLWLSILSLRLRAVSRCRKYFTRRLAEGYASEMERKDWLLFTLNAAGGAGLTPAQLQKSLFILGCELPDSLGGDFYQFSPYNYGPFSKQVYDDAERLAQDGLVTIAQAPGMRFSEYVITWRGQEAAERLKGRADHRAITYLERVVNWARKQSFSELVRAIYRKYPQYRVNSVFQD
jgi:uncharacterized protein YwgA